MEVPRLIIALGLWTVCCSSCVDLTVPVESYNKALVAQVPLDSQPILAVEGVDLATASITTINPLIVAPGTLVVIEGTGFGTMAGKIQVGTNNVDTFLTWEDTFIHFRIPSTIEKDSHVKVGNAFSNSALQPAPVGTIKLIIVVDTSKVAIDGLTITQVSRLTTTDIPSLFKPPLYFKGGFSHTEGTFGFKDDMWGMGAKWRMYNPSGTIWMTECLFTSDAIASFRNVNNPLIIPGVKFCFDDENLERNILEFESDFAAALKKSFQKQSGATGNDPVAYLVTSGKKSSWSIPKGILGELDAVIAAYPVFERP